MKFNFKVITIYILLGIVLPLILSFYLTNKTNTYFYNYKIVGIKLEYKNKLDLYEKVGDYMSYGQDEDDPSIEILNKILKGKIKSISGFSTSIFEKPSYNNSSFNVILRGDKNILQNIDFESYTYEIENGLRMYFQVEKINLIQVIEKLQTLKSVTTKEYGRRLKDYATEEVFKSLQSEMASIMTSLETRILVPKLRLQIINDINNDINETKYIYNYEVVGGEDKGLRIIFDHFIKFFILANIILILFNPAIVKKAYKLLNVKN